MTDEKNTTSYDEHEHNRRQAQAGVENMALSREAQLLRQAQQDGIAAAREAGITEEQVPDFIFVNGEPPAE